MTTFSDYIQTVAKIADTIPEVSIKKALTLIKATARKKKTIFVIGNGGSAATSSHMATDLAKGVFHRGGPSIPIISLSDNTSLITAIGNDLGYEEIFSEQLRSLAHTNDLLICITASGNSPNILRAVKVAHQIGMKTIALTGFDGGKISQKVDIVLHAVSPKGLYGPVEDTHALLMHYFVEKLVEGA